MRAWRVDDYGDYRQCLRLETAAPEPVRKAGQVLVDVRAVGLNFADLLSIQGRYQVKAPLPFTPGIEASGGVAEADEAAVLELGQRVIAAMPWGDLESRRSYGKLVIETALENALETNGQEAWA